MDEKDFSMRLATLRTKKNVSAREMSLSIGQNQGYINHIESGQGTPSLSGIFYICEYLGITPSQFFDFDLKNPEKLNKINEYLKKLNDKQLNALEMFLKSMTSDE
ncbi:MAG: helix-turn-helix transcriptional regulator [Eubacteriales bacterium]|nr:helix-turn-helix transcriptional regulator [Eubacteriales bacterium]MDY4212572.1 helix-turn-helix transcriptional regulator [Eubacteriales bacterium]